MTGKLILLIALALNATRFGALDASAQPAVTNRIFEGEILARYPAGQQSINTLMLSPDGKTLAVLRGTNTFWHKGGEPLTLQLFSANDGTRLWSANTFATQVYGFSPDGSLLAGVSANSDCAFWNTATGEVKRSFHHQSGPSGRPYFLSDGRTLAIAVNEPSGFYPMFRSGEIQFWDLDTGHFVRRLKAQTNAISMMAACADGKIMAAASDCMTGSVADNQINILNLESDSVLHTVRFDVNVYSISSLVFSPDGKTLAAGGQRHDGMGEIRLWDVASGDLKHDIRDADLHGVEPGYPVVVISPDGKTLTGASDNQTIIWWDVATGTMQRIARGDQEQRPGYLAIQFFRNGLVSARVNNRGELIFQRWPL